MPDPAADVDREIRARAAEATNPGDVVIAWFSVAGVRHPDGGGYVILDRSDDAPPDWMIRGMLCDALAALDATWLPPGETGDDYDDA